MLPFEASRPLGGFPSRQGEPSQEAHGSLFWFFFGGGTGGTSFWSVLKGNQVV